MEESQRQSSETAPSPPTNLNRESLIPVQEVPHQVTVQNDQVPMTKMSWQVVGQRVEQTAMVTTPTPQFSEQATKLVHEDSDQGVPPSGMTWQTGEVKHGHIVCRSSDNKALWEAVDQLLAHIEKRESSGLGEDLEVSGQERLNTGTQDVVSTGSQESTSTQTGEGSGSKQVIVKQKKRPHVLLGEGSTARDNVAHTMAERPQSEVHAQGEDKALIPKESMHSHKKEEPLSQDQKGDGNYSVKMKSIKVPSGKPEDEAATLVNPTSVAVSPGNTCFKSRHGHVKRPMNAYMIWARTQRSVVAKTCSEENRVNISEQLGLHWNKLSDEEKKPYFDIAEKIRLMHREEFPDYTYQPRRKKEHSIHDTSSNRGKFFFTKGLLLLVDWTYQPRRKKEHYFHDMSNNRGSSCNQETSNPVPVLQEDLSSNSLMVPQVSQSMGEGASLPQVTQPVHRQTPVTVLQTNARNPTQITLQAPSLPMCPSTVRQYPDNPHTLSVPNESLMPSRCVTICDLHRPAQYEHLPTCGRPQPMCLPSTFTYRHTYQPSHLEYPGQFGAPQYHHFSHPYFAPRAFFIPPSSGHLSQPHIGCRDFPTIPLECQSYYQGQCQGQEAMVPAPYSSLHSNQYSSWRAIGEVSHRGENTASTSFYHQEPDKYFTTVQQAHSSMTENVFLPFLAQPSTIQPVNVKASENEEEEDIFLQEPEMSEPKNVYESNKPK